MSGIVSTLRVRPKIVRLGANGDASDTIMVRAQVPEVWDAVRIEAPRSATVLEVKRRALAELVPDEAADTEVFVVKVRGFEVLDDNGPVSMTGAREGSSLLLAYRRRRPVR
jgi:hypothetical protein